MQSKCHEDAAQEVEVVVAVIYELGEGASEAAFKPGSGPLATLSLGRRQTLHEAMALATLITVPRMGSCTPHVVSILLLACICMRVKGMSTHTQAALPPCESCARNSSSKPAPQPRSPASQIAATPEQLGGRAALFRAALPCAGHPLVSGALLECYVRFSRYAGQQLHRLCVS